MGQWQYGDPGSVMHPIADARAAMPKGSMVSIDGTTRVMTLASEFPWNVDIATTRTAYIALFAGTLAQQKFAALPVYGNQGQGDIRINTSGEHLFLCTGTLPQVGQWVGPAKDVGNTLMDNTVEVVAALTSAIGKVTEVRPLNPQAPGQAQVVVDILSNTYPKAR